MGRVFTPDDGRIGASPVVLLSDAWWRRQFNADPDIVGKAFDVNGQQTTVIGVMPADFRFPRRDTDVWTNLLLNPPARYGPWFQNNRRLRQLTTELQALSLQAAEQAEGWGEK